MEQTIHGDWIRSNLTIKHDDIEALASANQTRAIPKLNGTW